MNWTAMLQSLKVHEQGDILKLTLRSQLNNRGPCITFNGMKIMFVPLELISRGSVAQWLECCN